MAENLSQLRTVLLIFGGITVAGTAFLVGDEESVEMIKSTAIGIQSQDYSDDENYSRESEDSDRARNRSSSHQNGAEWGSSEEFGEPSDILTDGDDLGTSAEGIDPSPMFSESEMEAAGPDSRGDYVEDAGNAAITSDSGGANDLGGAGDLGGDMPSSGADMDRPVSGTYNE